MRPYGRVGRVGVLGLALALGVSLSGCGGDDEPSVQSSTTTASTLPARSDVALDEGLAGRFALEGYTFEAKPEDQAVQEYPDYLVNQGLEDFFDGFAAGPVRTEDGTGVANVLVMRAKPEQDLAALDRRIQRVLTGTASSQIRSGVRVFLGQYQIEGALWTRYVLFRDGALYVLDGPDVGRLDTFLDALLAA